MNWRKNTFISAHIAKVSVWVAGVVNPDYSDSDAETVENVLMP
jgi:hypothetical protein